MTHIEHPNYKRFLIYFQKIITVFKIDSYRHMYVSCVQNKNVLLLHIIFILSTYYCCEKAMQKLPSFYSIIQKANNELLLQRGPSNTQSQ